MTWFCCPGCCACALWDEMKLWGQNFSPAVSSLFHLRPWLEQFSFDFWHRIWAVSFGSGSCQVEVLTSWSLSPRRDTCDENFKSTASLQDKNFSEARSFVRRSMRSKTVLVPSRIGVIAWRFIARVNGSCRSMTRRDLPIPRATDTRAIKTRATDKLNTFSKMSSALRYSTK